MTVRTRFAPSPTGVLHVGSVRTALFNWLYAKRFGGEFILRIEDTDRERSTSENVEAIFDAMEWLGLDNAAAPVFQSERSARYSEVIDTWLSKGLAYRCYCSREELESLRERQRRAGEHIRYDGRCRDRQTPVPGVDPVVRFRNPTDGSVTVNDVVKGEVVFNNSQLDDLVIARSDGSATYNLGVVVDDFDMDVTHVIRGDDHLNNTPRQMNLLAALGAPIPVYAHLPMILGADGSKLSKRHGAIDIREYRDSGYLASAVLNYLARLGWSHGDQEIFALDELMNLFDIVDVNHSASTFNPEKLTWTNRQHMAVLSDQCLGDALQPFLIQQNYNLETGPAPARVAAAFRDRSDTLLEMSRSAAFCYVDFEEFDDKAAKKHLRAATLEPLKSVRAAFEELADWSAGKLQQTIKHAADQHGIGMGKLGQPLRVAVTGSAVSPPIDITVELVGKARCLQRLDRAIQFVAHRAART